MHKRWTIPPGKPAAVDASDIEGGFHALHGHNDKETRKMIISFTLGILIEQNESGSVPVSVVVDTLNSIICKNFPFLTEFSTKEVQEVVDKLGPILHLDK